MSKPLKIVFLCSGGGNNLKFVLKAIRRRWIEGAQTSAGLSDHQSKHVTIPCRTATKVRAIESFSSRQNPA